MPESSLGLGTCVAGKPGYTPLSTGVGNDGGVDAYARWTAQTWEGQEVSFTVFNIDRLSEGACYTTQCTKGGTCDFGYYPVQNRPCYSSMHSEWRQLECCRQQRNTDGYLRGFDVHQGEVSGKLFFAACCALCLPGYVNTGCDAYRPGDCERCPAGTFNQRTATLPSTVCEPCQPCGPGLQRVSCGPSSPGRCEPCAGGTFKAAGLEGAVGDTCYPCEACPHGSLRTGCGSSSPGTCEPCPLGQWFASPFCRACPACSQGPRHGCGGTQLGVCSECAPSRHEQGDTCVACAACPEEPALEVLPGLAVSGPAVRIGCAGPATGSCVRLAATLQPGAPRCPTTYLPEAICQESVLTLRWVLEGLTPGEAVNCTSETGLCFAGRWKAALRRHLSQTGKSEEVQVLGEWWSAELDLATGPGFSPQVLLPPLQGDLAGGAGYFLRISLVDLSSSCCSASPDAPLEADTAPFALPGPQDLQEAMLESSATDGLLEDANSTSLASALAPVCSSGETTWSWSAWAACERLLAVQLGAPLGPWGSPPVGLSLGAEMKVLPEDAARDAMIPVAHARDRLRRWQDVEEAYRSVMPSTHFDWQSLVLLQNSSNSSNSSNSTSNTSANDPDPPAAPGCAGTDLTNCSSPLRPLWVLSREAALAAVETRALWYAELAAEAEALGVALAELKEINGHLSASASAVGFDVVRMAQAVMLELWDRRWQGSQNPGLLEPADFSAAFQKIGSMALFLLGSWGSTWKHSLEWHMQAGLGDPINRSIFSPEMAGLSFGGAAPAIDAVPLAQSRTRVWEPFHNIAVEWLDDWAHARQRLTEEAQDTSQAGALAAQLRQLLAFTADATELLLEPTTRAGSVLLSGPLPNISACTGSCLGLLSSFGEAASQHARLAIGQQSIRPWLDPHSEEQRLQKAAAEVTGLVRGRALALDALLARLLRVRELQLELDLVETAKAAAGQAESRLAALAGLTRDLDALYHWQEVRRLLGRAVSSGRASAGRLGRQRLSSLENVAAWALQKQQQALPQSQVGQQSARSLWSPVTGTATGLDAAMHSAGTVLEASLTTTMALAQQRGKGWLRLEIDESSHPAVMSSLEQTNSAMIWLEPPAGVESTRMFPTALAFLISPADATQALAVVAEGSSSGGNSRRVSQSQAFVELELRHLPTGAQDREPQLLGRGASFVTQHERRLCQPLNAASLSGSGAPLLPLSGMWIVQVRDGPSQASLRIDPGSTLRLLFEVEEPLSAPPWQLLAGMSDFLYETAADGDCNGIRAIWGAGNPISTEPQSTTTEALTTTSAAPTSPSEQGTDVDTTQAASLPGLPGPADPSGPGQGEEVSETWFDGLVAQPLLLALLFGCALGLCCCSVVLVARCRILRVRRSRKIGVEAAAEEKEQEQEQEREQKSGSPGDFLSYNVASPSKQGSEKEDLRASAATLLLEEEQQPQAPEVPQSQVQDRARGEDEEDGESWQEAATPSAASVRSQSQGSSCSSRSSSASSRRPQPERHQPERHHPEGHQLTLKPLGPGASPLTLPGFGEPASAGGVPLPILAPGPPAQADKERTLQEENAAGAREHGDIATDRGGLQTRSGDVNVTAEQHAACGGKETDRDRRRDDYTDSEAATGAIGPSETSTRSGVGSAGAPSVTCSVVSGRSCQPAEVTGEVAGRDRGVAGTATSDAATEPADCIGSSAELLT